MKIFENNQLAGITLKNRIVMPPMCMYQVANHNGRATDFHFTHYTARAIGQVGLIIVEATGVTPNGRITDECLGLYDDQQIEPLKCIVDGVHQYGSKIAIQLNHAGRKCTAVDGVDEIVGPSQIAYNDEYRTPKGLSIDEIKNVIEAFKQAAIRAEKAGFDGIEIHGAHGYLISEFLSPLVNTRADEYGFPHQGRFLCEVVEAMTSAVSIPVWIRVSTTDYETHGYTVDDLIPILEKVKDKLACIHVSSGGITPVEPIIYAQTVRLKYREFLFG